MWDLLLKLNVWDATYWVHKGFLLYYKIENRIRTLSHRIGLIGPIQSNPMGSIPKIPKSYPILFLSYSQKNTSLNQIEEIKKNSQLILRLFNAINHIEAYT